MTTENAKRSGKAEPEEATELQAVRRLKWWQLLIIYPTIATSFAAAIPTVIEIYRSNKYGVEFGESAQAREREKLFLKNMTCTVEPFQWYRAANNVEVDATICTSGDVLVRLRSPFNTFAYDWVSVERLVPKPVALLESLSPLGSAHAAAGDIEVAQMGRLICQFNPAPGTVVFRYASPAGCYDDVVNTYTGQVMSRRGAPCGC